ncbi:tripartite tricarboxylate transporter substrate binding protein [Bordetella genomosp. 11]|uniref:LacI family transcriptional regulator n=1 Tax=Bordetella genomosp. 11 TaxID=1416808 RepID=A0A261UDU8_9BORD|nr:tripartite tricarboxylate transporter substrate binding protein [Bordetella genomosp. 11]OZI59420.1 LacI family transcriptional regulator [Bordetella genomosp. 11]
MFSRRFLTLISSLFICASAAAQYPERPVKLIVPYAPGGSVDIVARMISDEWARTLGRPIVIENRGGAGGNVGVDAVAKAAADGYTIGVQSVSLAINPALFSSMPYDTLKDLAPIGMVASSQHVLVVNDQVPAKSVRELVDLAKREPGKLSYASAGPGSTFHMAAALFTSVAGVDIVHIPYRGGGPALIDTIGGQVQLCFPVLSAARGQVEAGKVRALGVTGSKRSPLMPDVPAIAEAGLPGYAFETWFMVFAPANTPKPVIDKLNETLAHVLASPAMVDRMTREGFEATPSSPAQARTRLETEMPQWAKLIKESGITMQ